MSVKITPPSLSHLTSPSLIFKTNNNSYRHRHHRRQQKKLRPTYLSAARTNARLTSFLVTDLLISCRLGLLRCQEAQHQKPQWGDAMHCQAQNLRQSSQINVPQNGK